MDRLSECFTHQCSGRPLDDRSALLTTVLSDGINLCLTRMSEACRGATLRQLAWIHDWHVREECHWRLHSPHIGRLNFPQCGVAAHC